MFRLTFRPGLARFIYGLVGFKVFQGLEVSLGKGIS